MQAIRYRITALSPLLFTSNTGDPNMVATLDYIPGSYLRGLFAGEHIRKMGAKRDAHRDEDFYRWFLKGELKITNAYIIQKRNEKNYPFLPIPLSIQKEKGEEHTAYDLLFQDEEFDKQTTVITGYGRLEENILYKKTVKKSLNFHHARDRERGLSKEGQIFNYESINEGQIFEGFIIAEAEDIKKFISIISDGIYYIGKSRNNQYGKIRFEIVKKEPVGLYSELNIEQALKQKDNIVLTLLSDTIIYNGYGYSTTNIEDLEKELGCKIKKAFIKQSEEEGFISVWKLKTPSEICFRAGSCFLLENVDIEKLKELLKRGIGIKTHEGFGRFIIGWQDKEKPLSIEEATDETIPSKPAGAPNEGLRVLVQNIVKEHIKKHKQIEAIKDVEAFLAKDDAEKSKKLPSKSLLAKIEGSVRNGSFRYLLRNLKKTAIDKLESCRDENKNLYEFLTEFSLNSESITKIVINISDMENLCNEISYQPDKDEDFKKELEKIYLITFLSTMRKKVKEGGKKGKLGGGEQNGKW